MSRPGQRTFRIKPRGSVMQARGFFLQLLAFFLLYQCTAADAADDSGTRLLRQPSLSRDHLAFVFGGDIWISDRDGRRPVRITAHPASEFAPHFSPDGRWIAFSAAYDNNTDVYVVSVEGGQPRRLTWHPAADLVAGWSSDSKRVLFTSNREIANSRSSQLFEVPLTGGYEKPGLSPLHHGLCRRQRLASTSRWRHAAHLDH
jgi:tricorn protease-like protein